MGIKELITHCPPCTDKNLNSEVESEAGEDIKEHSILPPPCSRQVAMADIIGFKDSTRYQQASAEIRETVDDKDEIQQFGDEFAYLSVWYANAESLTNKHEEFLERIAECSPDIISVVETWVQSNESSVYYWTDEALELRGYTMIRKDNAAEIRGGILVYVKEELEINTDIGKHLSNLSSEFKESLWLNIKIEESTVLFGTVYKKPDSTISNDTLLREMIEEAAKQPKVLIVGDFNYRQINWKENTVDGSKYSKQCRFYDCIDDSYLSQHVKEFTRKRGTNKPSTLDLIITEIGQTQVEPSLDIQAPMGSGDHAVLHFKYLLDVKLPSDQGTSKYTRKNYHKGNYDELRSICESTDWLEVLYGDDKRDTVSIEDMANRFYSKLTEIEETTIPKIEVDRNKKEKPPWMDKSTKRIARKKYFSWKRYQESRTQKRYLEYIKHRDKAAKKIRQAKRNFEQKIAKECKSNPKAFYKYYNFKNKSRNSVIRLRNTDGKLQAGDEQNANILNNFFKSVYTTEDDSPALILNEASQLLFGEEPSEPFDMNDNDKDHTKIPFEDFIISEEEIYVMLKDIDCSKSSSPQCVHPRVLKEAAKQLTKPIHILYETSLHVGELPSRWKKSYVSPIFKAGDKHVAANYRPVAITSILCRMLEKIIRNQMLNHIKNNEILNDCQHGFRERRSCDTNLLETLENITRIIDEGSVVDEIFLDLAKAFDKVPHRRLMYKLKRLGISDTVLCWVESFITGRTQQVNLRGKLSKSVNVLSGVPQGSVLGPILFTLYINDLPQSVASMCSIFADDTKLYRKINTIEDADALQNDLNMLIEWCNTWGMTFNAKKCKVMHFGKNNCKYLYHMEGCILQEEKDQKDLGVMVSSSLKVHSQVVNCAKKANKVVNMIKRTFSFLDKDIFVKLYKTFVRPIIEYGQTVWAPYHEKDINILEDVQRRATKLVPGMEELDYEERLKQLKLYSLEDRRRRGDMIYTYKIINSLVNVDQSRFFRFSDNPHRSRGHLKKLELSNPKPKTDIRRNFFSQRSIIPWNELSAKTVDSSTTKEFKRNYDISKNLKCF